MISYVLKYAGDHKKKTIFAMVLLTIGVLASMIPYLQHQIEGMPLGRIQDIGMGQLKKIFTDDIDGIELLLAHAVPEGFSNLMGATVMILAMFFVDVRMALLSVAALVLALIISFTERTYFCLGDMLWYSRGFLFGCQAFRESKDASLTRAPNAYILYAPEG